MSKLKYYDGAEWKTVNGQITGDTLPIGAIIPYGSTTAPANWLVCDGSAVSRTTYAELFAIIGTSYGAGDGSTTFNLPNYKGRVPVGYDSTQTEFDTIGETGGSKALQEHYHNYTAGAYDFTASIKGISSGADTVVLADAGGAGTHTATAGTGNSGNLQPYQVSCFIIKAFQSSGLIANVSNTQSNSQTDTYSCDYENSYFGGVVLYNDTTGTMGNVTLSNSVVNYKKITILYRNGDGYSGTIDVLNPNTQTTTLTLSYYNEGTNKFMHWAGKIAINDNTITHTIDYYYENSQGSITPAQTINYISILKVVGYK